MTPDDLRTKLEAGRAATVADLRRLARRLEALPLEDAGEVLAWIAPHVGQLAAEAERILGRRA